MTPTQLTLRDLRNDGWLAEVVERWNPHSRTRHDLFGFVDIVAVKGDETLAVQTTSGSNAAARVRKIADHPSLPAVREAGWRVEVHGWTRRGRLWAVRKIDIS